MFHYFLENFKKTWFGLFMLRIYVLLRTSSFKMALGFGRQDYEVLEIEDFLSHDECDKLLEITNKKLLIQSTISNDYGERLVDTKTRKSYQCWLKDEEDSLVETISKRMQEYVPLPLTHHEDLQIVRYSKTDYYRHHYDTPYLELPISKFNKACGPRVATFLIYLNDNFEGGETEFVIINKKVIPKKGKAILFYNIDINLTLIPESLHMGRTIKNGEKWIANKWIRVWPFKIHDSYHISQNSWMMNIKKCNKI